MEQVTGIADAVRAAGGQAALAKVLGVSQQFVSSCLKRGYVPMERAIEIEAQFGIPRVRLIDPRVADLLDLRRAEA